MRRPLLALLCLLAATPALGGAWPRGEGNGFMSVTTRFSDGTLPDEPGARTSLFLDYGVTARSGLSFELDTAEGEIEKALAFHNFTWTAPDSAWQFTTSLGAGTLNGEAAFSPRASVGRGFTIFGTPGWAEAVASGEFTQSNRAGKLDLTLGLAPDPRLRTFVQVFAYKARGGETFIRGESSVAYQITRDIWIDGGISTGITPDTDHRFKIGIWTAF